MVKKRALTSCWIRENDDVHVSRTEQTLCTSPWKKKKRKKRMLTQWVISTTCLGDETEVSVPHSHRSYVICQKEISWAPNS
jgi:hypothetical protein